MADHVSDAEVRDTASPRAGWQVAWGILPGLWLITAGIWRIAIARSYS